MLIGVLPGSGCFYIKSVSQLSWVWKPRGSPPALSLLQPGNFILNIRADFSK